MESTNSEAIQSFIETYEFETAPIGETIVLPDTGQVFTVLAQIMFDYGAGHVEPAGYQWVTPCALCGVRHMFVTPREFRALTRLCPEHMGRWRAPRASKSGAKAPVAPAPKSVGAYMQHLADTWTAMYLARGEVTRDNLIKYAVQGLPDPAPGTRDVRRQNIVRALQSLQAREDVCPFVQVGEMLLHREGDRN